MSLGYIMGQFGSWSSTIRGMPQAIESQVTLFCHFDKSESVLIIQVFHQESVHRCNLEYSPETILDFWIYHPWAICWASKCLFSRCQKVANFSNNGYFEIWPKNLHKGVKICNLAELYFLADRFLTYVRLSNF